MQNKPSEKVIFQAMHSGSFVCSFTDQIFIEHLLYIQGTSLVIRDIRIKKIDKGLTFKKPTFG